MSWQGTGRTGEEAARICVVDDDAAVRHAMLNLLEAGGYRALGFESGEAFLAWPRLADIEDGDVLLGLASSGVHANGYTLARRVLDDEDYDGDDLLAPTRLYLDVARELRGRAKAFVHVTGGGILGNLERVLTDGRTASIDWNAWPRLPVFAWLARHVEEDELRRFVTALEQVLADAEEHLFRSYASLGFTLGRRTLTARRA